MKVRKLLIKNIIIILFVLIFFINCTKKINNKNLEKRNSTVNLKEKYLNYGIDLENVKDNLVILKKINNIMKEKNYRIVNLDSIIVIQKPKLRPHIDSIRDNIAKILEIEPELVNVKAKTEEKLGFTGDETGVKSYCVVLLEKDNVR